MDYGARIKAALKHVGMRQVDLARALGITEPSVSAIVRAQKIPPRLREIASAMGLDPAIFMVEDDEVFESSLKEASVDAPRNAGAFLRPYTLSTVIRDERPWVVRGPLGAGAVGDTSEAVEKALKHSHHQRAGGEDYRTLELAIPAGTVPIDLRTDLEVKVSGRTTLYLSKGQVLIADPLRKTIADGDLVVAALDVDPFEAEDGGSRVELRRYERGPRGVELLFELDRDEAVTVSSGWRIVAPIVDYRKG